VRSLAPAVFVLAVTSGEFRARGVTVAAACAWQCLLIGAFLIAMLLVPLSDMHWLAAQFGIPADLDR
jgi:hypothetical protein